MVQVVILAFVYSTAASRATMQQCSHMDRYTHTVSYSGAYMYMECMYMYMECMYMYMYIAYVTVRSKERKPRQTQYKHRAFQPPYLQTGSGKTYTMGTGFDMAVLPEQQGVIPRAVRQLFSTIEQLREEAIASGDPPPQFEITAQFLEVTT